ncbi:MAG: hypothetical protein LBB45_03340 [Methanobrevibacter sp.]|jgi:hypothetical protein|nr:hypothetical protein [Candidatus Methanovirga basalitermitum]
MNKQKKEYDKINDGDDSISRRCSSLIAVNAGILPILALTINTKIPTVLLLIPFSIILISLGLILYVYRKVKIENINSYQLIKKYYEKDYNDVLLQVIGNMTDDIKNNRLMVMEREDKLDKGLWVLFMGIISFILKFILSYVWI